ncbi:MAG TPA: DinB family protein [Chthonomonadaceae bacterium]|jgi:uncharacterized damage-inducible protein DinB|nr:DinB family protein [Chthonomonadaceae bacterium]
MAFTLDDVLNGVRASRQFFLKHLNGLREDQWDWRPGPECKTIRETLAHLITDDRAALQSLQTGEEPDYDALQESERDIARLRVLLEESFTALCAYIQGRYAGAPLDTEVCSYGGKQKLGRGVAYLSSEDFYHAGQVAMIRIATDPAWDYYASIYGGE